MRGIKSHGMILAATSIDGKVELMVPPVGSVPGDVVTLDGVAPDLCKIGMTTCFKVH